MRKTNVLSVHEETQVEMASIPFGIYKGVANGYEVVAFVEEKRYIFKAEDGVRGLSARVK